MTGTHIDIWAVGLTWVLTLLSLVGLLVVAGRLVARRLLLAHQDTTGPRGDRGYRTVPASEQTGENLRPVGLAAQRSSTDRRD